MRKSVEEMDKILKKGIYFAKDAKDSAALFFKAVDDAPGGLTIYEVTEDAITVLYYNDQMRQFFGFEEEEKVTANRLSLDEFVVSKDHKRLIETVISQETEGKELFCEFRVNQLNKGRVWVCFRARKIASTPTSRIYSAVFLDVNETKEQEIAAKRLALRSKYSYEHDELTGLYRKEAFEEKARELIDSHPDKDYVIVKWDAEHFKLVNELAGYETGNLLLVHVSNLILKHIGSEGVAGRLGADHFIMCFPLEMLDIQKAFRVAHKLLANMEFDFDLRIYAGIYVIQDRSEPMHFMCDKASLALASIKGKYMECYAYYDKEMMQNMVKEQEIKNDMWEALKKEHFKVYVQPKFDISSGKIVGGEALVRWKHPVKGFVNPIDFIPFFERSGFISNMDQYIWRHVAKYLHECIESSKKVLPISVNISRVDFYKDNLYVHFVKLLDEYHLSAKYMELEVTESAYTNDDDVIFKTLEQLQKIGFTILIDDFGSGYSSFSMMKQAPVDVLKLDMEFLRGIDQNGRGKLIVKHMVEMARELLIPVIAEGVETLDHVELLQEIGCDYAQGYFYSQPIPLEEYDRMVQQGA